MVTAMMGDWIQAAGQAAQHEEPNNEPGATPRRQT